MDHRDQSLSLNLPWIGPLSANFNSTLASSTDSDNSLPAPENEPKFEKVLGTYAAPLKEVNPAVSKGTAPKEEE